MYNVFMIPINEICLFPYFDSSLSLFYGLKICYVRHHEMVFTSYFSVGFGENARF